MQNIFQSITAAMADIKAIEKSQKNKDQGFLYRGIDDIYNELNEILAHHKIFTVPKVLDRQEKNFTVKSGAEWTHVVLKVEYYFYAEDGSSVVAIVFGEGRDGSDKGSNKALSIAHKYALIQVFCIPTIEDKDPDGCTTEKIQPKKPEVINQLRGDFNRFETGIINLKNLEALKITQEAFRRRQWLPEEQNKIEKLLLAKEKELKEGEKNE